MQQIAIKTERAHKMLVNRIAKDLTKEVGIFESVKVKKLWSTGYCATITVANEESNILTFPEIDRTREVIKKYADKYGDENVWAMMTTGSYLARVGNIETWLSRPVIEVFIAKRGEV